MKSNMLIEENQSRFSYSQLRKNWFIAGLVKVLLGIETIIIVLYILNIIFYKAINPIDFHLNFLELLLETDTLNLTIILSMPILLTAVGSSFNERAGVINIGVEGIMVWGAWATAYFTYQTGNAWKGVLGAVFFGLLISLLHAVFTITLKAEQIVTGVAVNFLALGLTEVLTNLIWDTSYSPPGMKTPKRVDLFDIPVIGSILKLLRFSTYYDVPVIGDVLEKLPDFMVAFNNHHGLIYLAILLIPLSHILLFHTSIGLRMRVIGEHPQTAATAGISVRKYQYFAVLISGVFASLGGAALVFTTTSFKTDMVNGRGFMGLAAMIFGKWTIIGSVFAALFFGFFLSLKVKLQISLPGFRVPIPFIQMIPPVVAILTLAGFIGRARPPKAIGKPYDPTES